MPVFRLSDEVIFPPPEFAEKDGLLAVGGDLSIERLLAAYSMGIFPWYSEESPILWWSPDPRLVLFPDELKVSRSLKQNIKRNLFEVTADSAFEQVIEKCADIHKDRHGSTWITDEMKEAYVRLHCSGFAHSIESWAEDELVGGLYGVSLGRVFFGESMFTLVSNASKVAFVHLTEQLKKWKFKIIDCQVTTRHLMSLGAREIPRSQFLSILHNALEIPKHHNWWAHLRGQPL